MEEILDGEVAERRRQPVLLAAFASVAMLLASLGIYGVLSYSVTLRRQEIGVRMALGARQKQVLHMVVVQGMRLAAIGALAGVAGAAGLARVMTSLLFGISPTDPATFAGVPLFFLAVALAACYIPARRATKIDPIIALRCE